MTVGFRETIGLHAQALVLRERRGEILASNIANAATPQFKARDFDFESELARSMGVMGLPVTVIVNPEGHEVGRLIGDAHWDSPDAQALIKALMAADGS